MPLHSLLRRRTTHKTLRSVPHSRARPPKGFPSLGAYDERGVLIPIGNVTVAKKYVHQIEVEGVVQVRYLYATPGHQLYQPTLDASSGSIRRDDKKPSECLLAQLKYEGQD